MENPYVLQIAVSEDVGNWMDMVHIVKENFPGIILDEYKKTLEQNIGRQTAYMHHSKYFRYGSSRYWTVFSAKSEK